jgi:hypothetical protein
MNYFAGCDPDLHTMPWAVVDENLRCSSIMMYCVPSKHKDSDAVLEMCRHLHAPPYSFADALADRTSYPFAAIAVESQVIYPLSAKVKQPPPNDILHLGQVAGAAVAVASRVTGTVYFPTPAEWKGQVDKIAHHKRILRAAGVPEIYWMENGGKDKYMAVAGGAGPPWAGFNRGDFKHILDAVGLAQYAATRYRDEQLKARYLQEARTCPPNTSTSSTPSPTAHPT